MICISDLICGRNDLLFIQYTIFYKNCHPDILGLLVDEEFVY